MALIDWDDALYSVKIKEFDEHHKKILHFINDLHKAMMEGRGKDIIRKIFTELSDYTHYHFQAEEKEMQAANYPGYTEHKQQHDMLIQQLSELMDDFDSGKREVSIDTFRFLKEWLFNHIQVTDKKYTPFLRK